MPTAGWKKRWQMERPARMGYKLSGVECGFMQSVFARAYIYIYMYVLARVHGGVIFDIWLACVGRQFIPLPQVKGGVWKSCVLGTRFFRKFTLHFERRRRLTCAFERVTRTIASLEILQYFYIDMFFHSLTVVRVERTQSYLFIHLRLRKTHG